MFKDKQHVEPQKRDTSENSSNRATVKEKRQFNSPNKADATTMASIVSTTRKPRPYILTRMKKSNKFRRKIRSRIM